MITAQGMIMFRFLIPPKVMIIFRNLNPSLRNNQGGIVFWKLNPFHKE